MDLAWSGDTLGESWSEGPAYTQTGRLAGLRDSEISEELSTEDRLGKHSGHAQIDGKTGQPATLLPSPVTGIFRP